MGDRPLLTGVSMLGMFDFQIRRQWGYRKDDKPGGWQVFLPHSCDEWEISWEDDTKEAAIERLRSFIAEAQATLVFLESAPDDWNEHYGPEKSMRFFDY